jgi:hypothetical protein
VEPVVAPTTGSDKMLVWLWVRAWIDQRWPSGVYSGWVVNLRGPVRRRLSVAGDRFAADRRSRRRCEGARVAGAAHRLRSGSAQLVGEWVPGSGYWYQRNGFGNSG